ncbi:MAG: M28 family peptidase [Planctomycetes bacterium]|nr:M28 family peptidase [Planctomycetota bacterium]
MRAFPFLALVSVLAACRGEPSKATLESMRAKAEAAASADRPRDILPQQALHGGPAVARGVAGSARFASTVLGAFQSERAMELARFADGFYREPGNDGFEAVLDRITKELGEAGYGRMDGLAFETFEHEARSPAWTPVSARLALVEQAGPRVLLAFGAPGDAARTMLPRNAPRTTGATPGDAAVELEGELVFSIDAARVGVFVVLEAPPSGDELARAKELGALGVFAAGIEDYNVDPTGRERHLDAIQYSSVRHPCPLPVARVSKRVHDELARAHAADPRARVAFSADVRFDDRPVRTLVATITGAAHPDEAVVVAAHVQEPGACDNASGLAGITEVARALAEALRAGTLARPARSIVFLFGLENAQSRWFLERTKLQVVAGLSADMLGESAAETGAVALLERMPDPGAVRLLPPDEHTAWGASPVNRDELAPAGLNVIARCALLDVAEASGTQGAPWSTREHPYEGGSDHAEYLRKGIPAVLFWHFPDFAYHTSLDRMAHVDAAELARSASAVATCALAVADAQPADLDRYLASSKLELDVRLAAALAAKDDEAVAMWRAWSLGARQWLRRLCLPVVAEPARVAPSAASPSTPPASTPPDPK